MDNETKTKGETVQQYIELRRIADAMEEILRLVKKDQEDSATLRRAREDK